MAKEQGVIVPTWIVDGYILLKKRVALYAIRFFAPK
jgi:hypothetical protein